LHNTRTAQNCYWVSQNFWTGWGWWRRQETRWYQICDTQNYTIKTNIPLESSLNVMSVVGTHNSLRGFSFFNAPMPGVGWTANNVLDGLGIFHTVAGVATLAGWWKFWEWPSGIAHLALGGIWLGRDWVWNGVTGASSGGDAIVPKESQYMYQYGTAMGGNPNFTFRRVEANINHTGQADAVEVLRRIREYQTASGLPTVANTKELPGVP
jgi:hypothetical protein